MYQYLYLFSRIVIYFLDFDLSLVIRFQDGINDGGSRSAVRYFCNDQSLVV